MNEFWVGERANFNEFWVGEGANFKYRFDPKLPSICIKQKLSKQKDQDRELAPIDSLPFSSCGNVKAFSLEKNTLMEKCLVFRKFEDIFVQINYVPKSPIGRYHPFLLTSSSPVKNYDG